MADQYCRWRSIPFKFIHSVRLFFPFHFHFKARELDAGSFDVLGGGYLLKKKSLDPLGGGHLVRNLDTLGGGHLVRDLDSLGGGHLIRNLDSLGSGHLVRQVAGSNLDNLGGGHLIDGSNGKLIRY